MRKTSPAALFSPSFSPAPFSSFPSASQPPRALGSLTWPGLPPRLSRGCHVVAMCDSTVGEMICLFCLVLFRFRGLNKRGGLEWTSGLRIKAQGIHRHSLCLVRSDLCFLCFDEGGRACPSGPSPTCRFQKEAEIGSDRGPCHHISPASKPARAGLGCRGRDGTGMMAPEEDVVGAGSST